MRLFTDQLTGSQLDQSIQFGRKRMVDNVKVNELNQSGVKAADIAQQLNIERSTVYMILQAASGSQSL